MNSKFELNSNEPANPNQPEVWVELSWKWVIKNRVESGWVGHPENLSWVEFNSWSVLNFGLSWVEFERAHLASLVAGNTRISSIIFPTSERRFWNCIHYRILKIVIRQYWSFKVNYYKSLTLQEYDNSKSCYWNKMSQVSFTYTWC